MIFLVRFFSKCERIIGYLEQKPLQKTSQCNKRRARLLWYAAIRGDCEEVGPNMIKVISRYEFGFREDAFEGYVFLKDETAIAQLHMYGDYYTFFWRGVVEWSPLADCLTTATNEIAKKAGVPFDSLNEGTVRYAVRQDLHTAPFRVVREIAAEQTMAYLEILGTKPEYFRKKSGPITFARFDIEGGRRLPIILWGDLTDASDSEIGFSSLVELPSSVMRMFQRTCRAQLDDSELQEVSGQVFDHMFATVS